MVNLIPLREKAHAVGGLLWEIISREPDTIPVEEFTAKAGTWLLLLKKMEKDKHGRG